MKLTYNQKLLLNDFLNDFINSDIFQKKSIKNLEDFKISNSYTLNKIKSKIFSLRGVVQFFSSHVNKELLKWRDLIDIKPLFQYSLFQDFLFLR